MTYILLLFMLLPTLIPIIFTLSSLFGVFEYLEYSQWCENRTLMNLQQPFNSITSWSYLDIGLFIIIDTFIHKATHTKHQYIVNIALGISLIYVSIGSFLYHSTNNYGYTGIIDISSIIISYLYILLFLNYRENRVIILIYLITVIVFAHLWKFIVTTFNIEWNVIFIIFYICICIITIFSVIKTYFTFQYNKIKYIIFSIIMITIYCILTFYYNENDTRRVDKRCFIFDIGHGLTHISLSLTILGMYILFKV